MNDSRILPSVWLLYLSSHRSFQIYYWLRVTERIYWIRIMVFTNELLNLDYLVYSSHKSGTQTLVSTLNSSGLRCRHCHFLPHINLKTGDFRSYLESYFQKKSRKLGVITVFREPMERHISSFFQGYGTRPLMRREVKNKVETIIYNYTINQLQEKFISELRSRSLIGYPESIHEIIKELQISTNDLVYHNGRRFGIFETQYIRLFMFRFDILFNDLGRLLAEITHKNIVIKNSNMSESKWYRDIYIQFKKSLVIPDDVVLDVYALKRDLIELFYSGNYNLALNQALMSYGGKRRIS